MRWLILLVFFLVAWACIPVPTQTECHRYDDCRECVVNYCAWCGKRPGVVGLAGHACYAPGNKPDECEAPPYFSFCTQDVTTPIDNRMSIKRRDGGVDGGDAR